MRHDAAWRAFPFSIFQFPFSLLMDVLLPRGWSPPVGYSNGVAVAPGRIVFVAGQPTQGRCLREQRKLLLCSELCGSRKEGDGLLHGAAA